MLKVAALVGPTAVGKTQLALELAERLDAEIVSVDSMQIYRGMDIGTDKATPEMQARVPHHLLDLFEPAEDVSVAEFQRLARAAIADISERGRLPLLVGGSGLYVRAVVDDLRFPPRSPEVRDELERAAEELGAEELHRRLAELDPAAAAKIDPANARRTVRALEVIELTGRPFSEAEAWDRFESIYDLALVGLDRDRVELYERIEARVEQMLANGLVEEVERLRQHPFGRTARQALGYRQVLECEPDELQSEIVRATKRFARRQLSWFRSDPRIEWFDASEPGVEEALFRFLKGRLALT